MSDRLFVFISAAMFFLIGLSYSSFILKAGEVRDPSIDTIQLTISFLFFYQIGKVSLGLVDRFIPAFPKKHYLLLSALVISGATLILSQGALESNLLWKKFCVLLMGASAVAGGVTLRDYLTKNEDLRLKRTFNTVTTIAWSSGIGLYSVLESVNFLLPLVATCSVLFILSFEFKIHSRTEQPIPLGKKYFHDFVSLLNTPRGGFKTLLLTGFLLYSVIVNLTNSSIIAFIHKSFPIPEKFLSLVLLLPIFGSLLSWLPTFDLKFKGSHMGKYLGCKFLTLLSVSLLFLAPSIWIFALLLISLGYFSNEETSLGYQLVSQQIPQRERRAVHSSIEVLGVLGTTVAWLLKSQLQNIEISFVFLFVALIIWSFYFSRPMGSDKISTASL
jgi:hypothetical protein